jgi:acetoin utilization deacetylase AcuC-like enzyme
MTTCILTDPRYKSHTDPHHVERAERLHAIEEALQASALTENDTLLSLTARVASEEELAAVHTGSYLESIRRFGEQGGGYIDPDTYMTPHSWEAATWAAGGVVRVVEAVANGECQNGFALVRPPGHHATTHRAMGFCLINNVAVAARSALNTMGLERVAVVDYDVHHGNGTQDIFYHDPQVLYCSTHASPFYPGTGRMEEIGRDEGKGATLNIPLPSGVGDDGYQRIFEHALIPALRRWQPQMILISAGYDAHWADPIGPMVLSVTGYARLTQMLYDLAAEVCEGKLVMVLEGGYHLHALGACVVASLRVLAGHPPDPAHDPLGPITAPEPGINDIITALQHHPLLI